MVTQNGKIIDAIEKEFYVWYEDNWTQDNVLHKHKKAQLVYVQSGYQYITVNSIVYLVPQNHAAWIPSEALHKTNGNSEKISLKVLFFDIENTEWDHPFYGITTVFSAPPVLKEIINYVGKWSKMKEYSETEALFLKAIFKELPKFCADSMQLHISIPKDVRLQKSMNFLNENFATEFKMEILSEMAMVSYRTFERIFLKETGMTVIRYLQMLRIIKSLELLSSGTFTISQIAFSVGYKSPQAFTTAFQSILNYNPSDFLKFNMR